MCSESMPKEFEKTTEVLPFPKYGISTFEEFKKVEETVHHQEWLKNKVGLSNDEIKLYQDNEAGLLDQHKKVVADILQSKLKHIYDKIKCFQATAERSKQSEEQPSVSATDNDNLLDKLKKQPLSFHPEGHPMNDLKQMEESLFGHLKNDGILPITKRRKILRRLERKKQRILSHKHPLIKTLDKPATVTRPGSLWDVKDKVKIQRAHSHKEHESKRDNIIGPKKRTMYTIQDNKIVRLESKKPNETENDCQNPQEGQIADEKPAIQDRDQNIQDMPEDYRAVDIVVPINAAEEQLLEGTKMCVDDIRKIDRFENYEPGIPSKVLYLKNIASTVTLEQLSLLFLQFVLENGGPIDVRLLSGRMRGQAFAAFQNEDLAIRALEEVNGTILSGRPIIAQFGRNSNRIQDDDDR